MLVVDGRVGADRVRITVALLPAGVGDVWPTGNGRDRPPTRRRWPVSPGVAAGSSALAAANDATLVSWARDGHDVTVTVRVGGQAATARATDGP